jgi:hypothetical protein
MAASGQLIGAGRLNSGVSPMRTQARFRTKSFTPLTEDSDQSENGRELAEWLCSHLPSDMQPDSMDEDWGYRIIFGDPDLNAKVSVCCGNVEDDQWSCFCEPYRSFTDKLLKRPLPHPEMERVIRAIDDLLSANPQFTGIEWFENDAKLQEFNHGPRAFS